MISIKFVKDFFSSSEKCLLDFLFYRIDKSKMEKIFLKYVICFWFFYCIRVREINNWNFDLIVRFFIIIFKLKGCFWGASYFVKEVYLVF